MSLLAMRGIRNKAALSLLHSPTVQLYVQHTRARTNNTVMSCQDLTVSQSSAATRLRCGGIFNGKFSCKFST